MCELHASVSCRSQSPAQRNCQLPFSRTETAGRFTSKRENRNTKHRRVVVFSLFCMLLLLSSSRCLARQFSCGLPTIPTHANNIFLQHQTSCSSKYPNSLSIGRNSILIDWGNKFDFICLDLCGNYIFIHSHSYCSVFVSSVVISSVFVCCFVFKPLWNYYITNQLKPPFLFTLTNYILCRFRWKKNIELASVILYSLRDGQQRSLLKRIRRKRDIIIYDYDYVYCRCYSIR